MCVVYFGGMTAVAGRVGVITDPPLQESISDPQTLLDALEEPVAEPLTLNPTDSDVSFSSLISVVLYTSLTYRLGKILRYTLLHTHTHNHLTAFGSGQPG